MEKEKKGGEAAMLAVGEMQKKAAAWGKDPDGCEAEEYSVRSYSARDSTATCRGISGVTARVGPG